MAMDAYSIEACSSSEEDNESLSSDDELINRMKLSKHSTDVEIDEFEKEMNDELEQVISSYNQASGSLSAVGSTSALDNNCSSTSIPSGEEINVAEDIMEDTQSAGENAGLYYDDSYFSSGSEDDCDRVGGEKSKSTSRRRIQTNEDLFYDPDMDDDDQRWMNKQRQNYRRAQNKRQQNAPETGRDTAGTNSKRKAAPTSDAILSCPACMTTLCIDCQRHEIYKMQFRAMFVINCTIARNELLKYNEPESRRKQRNKKSKPSGKLVAAETPAEQSSTDLYHPVKCAECSTEVAVLDKDEVYHFFNVVESLA